MIVFLAPQKAARGVGNKKPWPHRELGPDRDNRARIVRSDQGFILGPDRRVVGDRSLSKRRTRIERPTSRRPRRPCGKARRGNERVSAVRIAWIVSVKIVGGNAFIALG